MRYIITETQFEELKDKIVLDIKVGDTLLGGRFKNKKVKVKEIGKNEKGDITINGKPLLKFRIMKESVNDRTINLFQRVVNDSLKEMKSLCDDLDNRDDIDPDACNDVESLNKIDITNVEDVNDIIVINVNVYIETIFASLDIEDIIYNIKYFVEDKTGIKVKIIIDDVINTKQNKNW